MKRVRKGFSGRVTPLFPTMVVQAQEEIGEGSANPTDPHHTPTIIQPSTSQPQKKQKPRKPKRNDTEVPQPSGPTDNVADEAVYEEMDDSLERAATTATSLDAEQDRGNINKTQSKATLNEPSSLGTSSGSGPRRQETMGDTIAQTGFENVSKTSNDSLLAGVNTPRSDEDSLKLKELMELCTNLQNRVIDLEKTKTSQAQEIISLKRRVKRLEKKNRSKTHGLKRLYKVGLSARIESSEDEGLGEEDASKQGRIADIDANEDIYLVNVHRDEDMFGVNDLEGDEVIVETEVDHEVVVETEVASKDVNLSVDEVTLAQALAALKSAKPKADKVKVQDKGKGKMVEPEPVKKMSKKYLLRLDEELAFKQQAEEEEEERKELEQESSKKQKVEEDKESEELRQCLEIVPDDGDDVTIDATPLSIKSPTIVDYKIYREGKKSYFQIIRADGKSQMYLAFGKMLKNFNREDLEVLWSIVKARFKKTEPVNYMDNLLLRNLKTMFEHHVEDNVWKKQVKVSTASLQLLLLVYVSTARVKWDRQCLFIKIADGITVQDLTLNVDNIFQADDCDAFDSDVYEAPTAQTMFMANLSSADPAYDEASPSYDLNILSEVPDHDNYQDVVCEHHEYVKDDAVPVVQSNVSSIPNDAYMMILNDMHEQSAQCVSVTTQNNVVDKSLTAKLTTYKEQVELYERRAKFELTEREQKIDEQLRIVITDRNIKEEKLKRELHSIKLQLNSTINHNKSMVEEVTSSKKDFKQKENKYLEEFLDMKALKKGRG
ncbi:hypothetical protein Tco_0464844 [Tanacetum coccineum]